jgi:hypothetical protein
VFFVAACQAQLVAVQLNLRLAIPLQPSPSLMCIQPFRALGQITSSIPFSCVHHRTETFVTTCIGKSFLTYNVRPFFKKKKKKSPDTQYYFLNLSVGVSVLPGIAAEPAVCFSAA